MMVDIAARLSVLKVLGHHRLYRIMMHGVLMMAERGLLHPMVDDSDSYSDSEA